MPPVTRRYEMEEFARRGDRLYNEVILTKLSAKDKGKFVAMDIHTGEFVIGRTEMATNNRLRKLLPEAQIWMVRVGYPYIRRLGGGLRRNSSPTRQRGLDVQPRWRVGLL